MAGSDGNADNEFIELYNPGSSGVVLTGWTIKKKSSTGTESTLVAASRLEGKTIMSNKYFLIGHEGGYAGATTPDMTWPVSYSLAYTNNAILLYDANGAKTEEVHWDEIQAGQSLTRSSWTSSDFAAATPSPQNSQ